MEHPEEIGKHHAGLVLRDGHFVLMEMTRPSLREFALTFKIRDTGTDYHLDSQVFSVLYASGLSGRHYTFQAWAQDSATVTAMVGGLLNGLSARRPLTVENTTARALPVAVVPPGT